MELPSIITSILIAFLAIYLVINPLYQKKLDEKTIIEETSEEQDLKYLYVTLNEIEMEYNMGKLSEKDYQELRIQYETLIADQLYEYQALEEQQEKEFQQLIEKKKHLSQQIIELKALSEPTSEKEIQKLQGLEEKLAKVNYLLQKYIS